MVHTKKRPTALQWGLVCTSVLFAVWIIFYFSYSTHLINQEKEYRALDMWIRYFGLAEDYQLPRVKNDVLIEKDLFAAMNENGQQFIQLFKQGGMTAVLHFYYPDRTEQVETALQSTAEEYSRSLMSAEGRTAEQLAQQEEWYRFVLTGGRAFQIPRGEFVEYSRIFFNGVSSVNKRLDHSMWWTTHFSGNSFWERDFTHQGVYGRYGRWQLAGKIAAAGFVLAYLVLGAMACRNRWQRHRQPHKEE